MISLANKLLGEESILFKDKINFKYPGGEGFKPHQDVSAGWGKYCNKHINIAIPLPNQPQNGCIFWTKIDRDGNWIL